MHFQVSNLGSLVKLEANADFKTLSQTKILIATL